MGARITQGCSHWRLGIRTRLLATSAFLSASQGLGAVRHLSCCGGDRGLPLTAPVPSARPAGHRVGCAPSELLLLPPEASGKLPQSSGGRARRAKRRCSRPNTALAMSMRRPWSSASSSLVPQCRTGCPQMTCQVSTWGQLVGLVCAGGQMTAKGKGAGTIQSVLTTICRMLNKHFRVLQSSISCRQESAYCQFASPWLKHLCLCHAS